MEIYKIKFCDRALLNVTGGKTLGKNLMLVHWWLGAVPFYNFRYCPARVAYLLQNLPQLAHCLNIHVAPPDYTKL